MKNSFGARPKTSRALCAHCPRPCPPFRDTFGVELLSAGVPIERVSVLLGHQGVRVTEKHYNPGVRSRQAQLEADRAWSNDPMVLVEAKVTRRLRAQHEGKNWCPRWESYPVRPLKASKLFILRDASVQARLVALGSSQRGPETGLAHLRPA